MQKNKKPENPPAFPKTDVNAEGMILAKHNQGMSLRDYFANSAMKGMISNHYLYDLTNHTVFDNLAKDSYLLADAMLKQREL